MVMSANCVTSAACVRDCVITAAMVPPDTRPSRSSLDTRWRRDQSGGALLGDRARAEGSRGFTDGEAPAARGVAGAAPSAAVEVVATSWAARSGAPGLENADIVAALEGLGVRAATQVHAPVQLPQRVVLVLFKPVRHALPHYAQVGGAVAE